MKLSRKQEFILKSLYSATQPISAKKIKQLVLQNYNTSVSLPTIYHLFNMIENLELIDTIYFPKKKTKLYFMKHIVKSQNYMICHKCENLIGFYNKELERKLNKCCKQFDFTLLNHTICLYGVCKDCR